MDGWLLAVPVFINQSYDYCCLARVPVTQINLSVNEHLIAALDTPSTEPYYSQDLLTEERGMK